MPRAGTDDLNAFLAVAREKSFTRAAARLGVQPSALSHTIRGLEERLGVRLLNRTTRSVSPTEAGERLMSTIAPHLEAIDLQLEALSAMRDKPAGTVRITAGEHPAEHVLAPVLARILPDYPDIRVEVVVDASLTDIVTDRFDAGIRMGDMIARDMIGIPLGPEMRVAVVASPGYFRQRGIPDTPRDLTLHRCINMRFPTLGGLHPWEFGDGSGQKLQVRVEGQLIVNNARLARRAAVDGLGIACVPEHYVQEELADGRLERVLENWCEPFPGYHLFYPGPNRRQPTAAFSILLKALQEHTARNRKKPQGN